MTSIMTEVPGTLPAENTDAIRGEESATPFESTTLAVEREALRMAADAAQDQDVLHKRRVSFMNSPQPGHSEGLPERESVRHLSLPCAPDKSEDSRGSVGSIETTQSRKMQNEEFKDRVRKALVRPRYNVHDLYWEEGYVQELARSPIFEHVTLGVISVNAIWIAVDTDHNDEAFLPDAHWVFQVAEHTFCAFFTFEWLVRFLAFRRKCDGFKDHWFLFDSILVSMMVAETWVMTIIITASGGAGGGPLGSTGILRLFRLLRLSRMARMLRRCPELMILIKGMVAACRSVFFTLLLLLIVMYMFGIALTQLAQGSEIGETYFDTIPDSMFVLLIVGVFQDNILDVMTEMGEASYVLAAVFLIFIAIGTLMVMNMLIGVLCDVVSEVADEEREDMNLAFVRGKMLDVVMRLDRDGNMEISKDEFVKIMLDTDAVRALQEVGVDAEALVEMTEFVFQDEETGDDKVLTFCEFMDCILELRGSNKATVKDFVDLRKFFKKSLRRLSRGFAKALAGETVSPNSIKQSSGDESASRTSCTSLAPMSISLSSSEPGLDLQLQIGRLEAFLIAGLFELQQIHINPLTSPSPGTWAGKKQLLPSLQNSLSPTRLPGLPTGSSDHGPRGHLARVMRFVTYAVDEIQQVRSALPLPRASSEQERQTLVQDFRVELAQLEELLLTFGPGDTLSNQVELPSGSPELQIWAENRVAQLSGSISMFRFSLERLSSTGASSSHDTFHREGAAKEVS